MKHVPTKNRPPRATSCFQTTHKAQQEKDVESNRLFTLSAHLLLVPKQHFCGVKFDGIRLGVSTGLLLLKLSLKRRMMLIGFEVCMSSFNWVLQHDILLDKKQVGVNIGTKHLARCHWKESRWTASTNLNHWIKHWQLSPYWRWLCNSGSHLIILFHQFHPPTCSCATLAGTFLGWLTATQWLLLLLFLL